MEDRCAMCGAIIPEGTQVCKRCQEKEKKTKMEIDEAINGGNETLTKIKAINPQIVWRIIDGKAYYSIQYYDISDNTFHVGYSSYRLDIVVGWLNECFEEVAGTIEIQKLYNQLMKNEKDYQRALEEDRERIQGLEETICRWNEVSAEYQAKVQKCIERIDGYIEATYYNSVSGSISDGNKNAAYHNCKNIIKEEMGVVE